MLNGVALAVGEIVHGVNTPLVSGTMVMRVLDTVQQRIAEEHVGMRHVYLGTQHLRPVGIDAVPHFAEELEVLFYAAVPPGTGRTGSINRTAALGDLFLALVVDIGKPPLDQLLGPFVKLVEIVRRIEFLVPLETKPLDIFLDRIHILGIFLGGIRIIITKICLAAIFLGQAEIDAKALGMAKMQITVGLWRETGQDTVDFTGFEVILDNLLEKVKFALFFHVNNYLIIL